ncbi:cell wall metabolism sensor histidine kinase WalK [Halobacillus sp. Nhm2S1]|uniref:sensor histidine kinase n=1 Tax=Halobacillus sp. Nhm2S1 TaxID=2866716 RepID=UPI001C7399AA|nr:HAMP domain-containing sensor histidine kinase [Halobacillus sp. Nhm2S1]MBX0359395.1 HAMP domain-containing histidine kinase [Halobacillus sp. Nhm2S1]
MKHKISIKLGLLFLISMILIELLLFAVLYTTVSSHRINEVMEGLLTRGAGHRDVLENNFDESTLAHVALMESEAVTEVIITDGDGNILSESFNEVTYPDVFYEAIDGMTEDKERIIEDEWRTEPYVATVSPIIVKNEQIGNVFMFSPSDVIRSIIGHLTRQFVLVMIVLILVTILIVFALSKFITRPLIRMKEVTEKLSTGRVEEYLDEHPNDELGVLASSINRLSEDLERIKKERHDFLSAIAHELRTPLTYVKGYADVAAKKETSFEDKDKYLNIIKEEATHLTDMVQQLFQLAKMDENSFAIDPEFVDVSIVLKEVKDHLHPLLEEKKSHLFVDVPSNTRIYADPMRLKQVFFNIVDNALRYGGEETKIKITAGTESQHVIIRISDDGPGVPESALPYLFERLYRVDKARSREIGGTGLGLSIVREIIEMHEATVKAFNDEGLTILITWPKEDNNEKNSFSR